MKHKVLCCVRLQTTPEDWKWDSDILGNSDTEVNQCKSPSKEKYQETQTDPFPQSPTTAILRKKIKILQMRLNHRNKK
ncbi:Protein of unknown function, partial [Gryllus bimaculatus]